MQLFKALSHNYSKNYTQKTFMIKIEIPFHTIAVKLRILKGKIYLCATENIIFPELYQLSYENLQAILIKY